MGAVIIARPEVLSDAYVPEAFLFREKELREVVEFLKRGAGTLLVYGPYGVGKTTLIKFILDRYTEELGIPVLYTNAALHYTKASFFNSLFRQAGLMISMGRKSIDDALRALSTRLPFALVVDEANVLLGKNKGILYSLVRKGESVQIKFPLILLSPVLEPFLKGSVGMSGIKLLEMRRYSFKEMKAILVERAKHAFIPGTWEEEAVGKIAGFAYQRAPYVRLGINLLRESAEKAEGDPGTLTAEVVEEVLRNYRTPLSAELAEGVKERILSILKEGERDSEALAEALGMPGRTVREHLKELKEMGLIAERREGKEIYYVIKEEVYG